MPKQSKDNVSTRGKKRTRLWQGALALVVLAGMGSAYLLRDRASSSGADNDAASEQPAAELLSTSSSLRGRLVLPATPRVPRPGTLDPDAFFEPEVRTAYQAAKNVPEVLEHLPCYCGCFAEANHRSNLDCYHDNHGVT